MAAVDGLWDFAGPLGHPSSLELTVMFLALGLCRGSGRGDLVGPRTVGIRGSGRGGVGTDWGQEAGADLGNLNFLLPVTWCSHF